MNRQIILAFLLAAGSTAFATETELTTAESNRTEQQTTEQQIVDSDSTVETPTEEKTTFAQKAKGGLHRYFIRKDKKRTALNCTMKAVAFFGTCLLGVMAEENIQAGDRIIALVLCPVLLKELANY